MVLPRHDAVNKFALFGRCAAEVDAGGLNGFMPHQVRQKCDVIELGEEVLGETMTERVWIDHFRIDAIFRRQQLQLVAYSASGYPCAKAIAEKVAAGQSRLRKPLVRFLLKTLGNVETA